jgi:hypothetical protein
LKEIERHRGLKPVALTFSNAPALIIDVPLTKRKLPFYLVQVLKEHGTLGRDILGSAFG